MVSRPARAISFSKLATERRVYGGETLGRNTFEAHTRKSCSWRRKPTPYAMAKDALSESMVCARVAGGGRVVGQFCWDT